MFSTTGVSEQSTISAIEFALNAQSGASSTRDLVTSSLALAASVRPADLTVTSLNYSKSFKKQFGSVDCSPGSKIPSPVPIGTLAINFQSRSNGFTQKSVCPLSHRHCSPIDRARECGLRDTNVSRRFRPVFRKPQGTEKIPWLP